MQPLSPINKVVCIWYIGEGLDGTMWEAADEVAKEATDAKAKVGLSPLYSTKWISIACGVIARPTPPWPSHWPRPHPPTTLETRPPERLRLKIQNHLSTSCPHISCAPYPHIPCAPKLLLRPPIRSIGRRTNTAAAEPQSKVNAMTITYCAIGSDTRISISAPHSKVDNLALVT